jgi:hypothetical protein
MSIVQSLELSCVGVAACPLLETETAGPTKGIEMKRASTPLCHFWRRRREDLAVRAWPPAIGADGDRARRRLEFSNRRKCSS